MNFKYQYVLTSVPFDSSYDNAIRFDTREQQEDYFKVSSLFNTNTSSINFDFGNLLNTQIVIKSEEVPFKVMNYNYLILKNNNDNKPDYLYYFINRIEYLSGGNDNYKTQIKLYLSLDIINTYLLDIDFGDGAVIKRASLDRWYHGYLDFSETSPFRMKDDNIEVQHDLILKSREYRIPYASDTTTDKAIYQWLEDNIAGWLYVFLDKMHTYKCSGFKRYTSSTGDIMYVQNTIDQDISKHCFNNNLEYSEESSIIPDYGSICVPIYKTKKRIICRASFSHNFTSSDINKYIFPQFIIDDTGLNDFRTLNNDASYFFIEKASILPPWYNLKNVYAKLTNDNNLMIVLGYQDLSRAKYLGCTLDGKDNGVFGAVQQNVDNLFTYAAMTTYSRLSGSTLQHIYTRKTLPNETELNNNADTYIDSLPHGVFMGLTQQYYNNLLTKDYTLPYSDYVKYNTETYSTERKLEWCPALYNSNYNLISIQCNGANTEYALSDLYYVYQTKLGSKISYHCDTEVQFIYTEVLQPEITKFYIRPKWKTGIYREYAYTQNYTGLVSTCDLSVALVNSAYGEFLANNKNYWLQAFASALGGSGNILDNFKQYRQYSSTKTSTTWKELYFTGAKANNLLSMNAYEPFTSTSTIQGGWGKVPTDNIGIDIAKIGIQAGLSLVNAGLNVSNVKASPSNMKNSTGNTYFALATSGFGLYIDHYELMDLDKKRVYDYYYQYGYPLNKIGKIEDYINIRHYFNYIQADLQNISGKNGVSIPNEVRDKLRYLFNNGIRFWNVTDKMFTYDMENIENDKFIDKEE